MKLNALKTVTATFFLAAGSGCCIPTAATITPLPLPDRPTLYHWPAGAIDVLSEEVAVGIKKNQIELIGWGTTMENVIKSTH